MEGTSTASIALVLISLSLPAFAQAICYDGNYWTRTGGQYQARPDTPDGYYRNEPPQNSQEDLTHK